MKTETMRGFSTYSGKEVVLHAHLPTPADFPISRLQLVPLTHCGVGWMCERDVLGWAAVMGSDLTRIHADKVIKYLIRHGEHERCYVLLMGELFSDKHESFSVFVICPPEEGQPRRVELKNIEFITGGIFTGSKNFALPVVRRVCCEKV